MAILFSGLHIDFALRPSNVVVRDLISAVPALQGARSSLRLAPAVHGATVLFFGAVRLQKIRQTQTLLKLNRILGHGGSPSLGSGSVYALLRLNS